MEHMTEVIEAACTDIGISRENNQDSYLIQVADTDVGKFALAAVCDGVGGLNKGELASATVLRELASWFREELPSKYQDVKAGTIQKEWLSIIEDVNRRIFEYSKENQEKMATTFSGILILADGSYLIAHVGDSRVYRLNKSDEISLLTDDHTVVGAALKYGTITPEQALKDPRANVLTQCIGDIPTLEMDFVQGMSEQGDVYLICSDGLRHVITEEEMLNELNSHKVMDRDDMTIALKSLIEMCKERGEDDNITAAVVLTCASKKNKRNINKTNEKKDTFDIIIDEIGVNTVEII